MISVFENVWSKFPYTNISIDEVARIISSDQLKKQTISLQEILSNSGSKTEAFKALKNKLPMVTFAGEFSKRNRSSLTKYSELIVIDIDDLSENQIHEFKDQITSFKDVVLLFISPSGKGLKVVHKLKVDNDIQLVDFHRSAFEALKVRYKQTLGIEIDQSGKDLPRACFLCFDVDVYFNKEAEFFHFEPLQESLEIESIKLGDESSIVDVKNEDGESIRTKLFILGHIYEYLKKHKISITTNYDQWMKVGFALRKELGDKKGLKMFMKFSKLDKSFDGKSYAKQFFKGKPEYLKGIGMGTIVYYAQLQNYSLPRLNKQQKFALNKKLAENMLLEKSIKVRYNNLKSYREIKYGKDDWKRLQDDDLSIIYIDKLNGLFNKPMTDDWLNTIAKKNVFDPIKDLIKNLPKPDGKDYIKELSLTIQSDYPEMTELFLKKWLIGMMASLLNQEAYNENVLVIVGGQGMGKTRWVKSLLPKELKQYLATKNLDPGNKDDLLMLAQYAIILMDELSTILTRKASTEAFKAMTSMDSVSLRKAYGREVSDFSRKASIIGTSNESEFLKDLTGNRRFFSIEAHSINPDHGIDMMQVFAQVYALYSQGETWYLNESEIELVNEHNTQFEVTNTYEYYISKYCRPSEVHERITAVEIIERINIELEDQLIQYKIDQNYAQQIGRHLKALGFKQKKKKILGKQRREYGVYFDPFGKFEDLIRPKAKSSPKSTSNIVDDD